MEKNTSWLDSIAIIRVSTLGQYDAGDSPKDQREKIILKAKRESINIVAWFEFAQSASGKIQPSEKCLEYLKQHPIIKYAIFMSIERFTRGGTKVYLGLRDQYRELGVELLDSEGVISRERTNTMERYGTQYSWSITSPSEPAEIAKAQEAEAGFRRIMTQMISGNWDATLEGYWIGPTPPGYQSKRIKVKEGKHRFILEPHDDEGKWFKKMYENRILGISDKESVRIINGMNYKSRVHPIHDKVDRTRIMRTRGGLPLTVKQLSAYLENPIYVGIMIKKMTHEKPIKGANWVPIVTIEEWNKANEGRKRIVEFDGEIRIVQKQPESWRLIKTKDNPEFPYKWILCPKCRKPLHGSASTVPKEGRRNPAYHCTSRGHNFRVKKADFDNTLTAFIKKLGFKDDVLLHLKKILIEDYENERMEVQKDSIYLEDRVTQIAAEQLQLAQSIGKSSLLPVIRQLEADYQKLEDEKINIMEKRNKKEAEGIDINKIIKKVWHFLHNFEDGLLGQADPIEKSLALKSCFAQIPSYEDLMLAVELGTLNNGRLKRHIELIPTVKDNRDLSARRHLFSWHYLGEDILQQYEVLRKLESFYNYI